MNPAEHCRGYRSSISGQLPGICVVCLLRDSAGRMVPPAVKDPESGVWACVALVR